MSYMLSLDDAGANVSVYKNSFVAQAGTWLLRRNASNVGIEIKSIPAFQCNIIM